MACLFLASASALHGPRIGSHDIPRARVEPAAALARQAAVLGMSALLAVGPTPSALASCQLDCFRECDTVAPGNKGYCSKQCDAYCEEREAAGEATGTADVVRSDVTASAAAVKVGGQEDLPSTNNDLGIFGDSGVSYSKGVEDLFATVFGATRQSKNVNTADVDGFTSDIASAAKAAVFGEAK